MRSVSSSARAAAPSCTHARTRCLPPQLAGDWLVIKMINASTLKDALNHGLTAWTGDDSAKGSFPQVGGALRYAFDHTLPVDSRLVAAQLTVPDGGSGGGGRGTPVDLANFEGNVLILIDDYYASGGDE